MSVLIYNYECNICSSIYIGKKSRQLCNCISEHKGISFGSELQLTGPPFSKICINLSVYNNTNEHLNYNILDEEFNISDKGSTEVCILILVSLLKK